MKSKCFITFVCSIVMFSHHMTCSLQWYGLNAANDHQDVNCCVDRTMAVSANNDT